MELLSNVVKRDIKNSLKSITNSILFLVILDRFLWHFIIFKLRNRNFKAPYWWQNGLIFEIFKRIRIRNVSIRIEDFKLNLSVKNALQLAIGMTFNNFEPEVKRKISPSGIFIDIGAHIGFYTIKAAKKAERVISIEPHPQNFLNLRNNVQQNKLDNVILVNKALAEKNGHITLYLGKESGTHSIIKDKTRLKSIIVPATTLDSLIKDLKLSDSVIDLIKIDVEGAEIEVLTGGEKTLRKINQIIVETHGKAKEITSFLSDHGFTYSNLNQYHLYAKRNVLIQ